MTKQSELKIQVGIEGTADAMLQRTVADALQAAKQIEGYLKSANASMQRIKAASKGLGTATGAVSGGSPSSQLVNANQAGKDANARADRKLADLYERVAREMGPKAQERSFRAALRDAFVSNGNLTRAPGGVSQAEHDKLGFNELRARAEATSIANRNERFNADFDRAQREQRARDYIEHRKSRLDGERFEDNSMRANAAHEDRVRARALKQIEREEGFADTSMRANAAHEDRARGRALKQIEKEEGFAETSMRANAAHEDRMRTRLEKNVNNQTRARLNQGGFESMIARGDTTGAANLVQQVRGQIQQRFGRQASPQALNQIMDDAGSRSTLAQGKLNIASVDRDLKSFFVALKKMGHDAEEEMRRLKAQARYLADSRGISAGPVLREADRLSNDFNQRRDALGPSPTRPEPAPRPERESTRSRGRFGARLQTFTDYAGIGAVVGAVAYTASQTVELEKSLATLQAISGATNTQMAELATTISDVGQSSAYTLTEISAAATTLAQAGYSAQQIAKVLPDIKNLALASGSDINDSTAILSSVMTIFEKGMSESSYVADVLTQALNGSKLSLEQFSLGVQYAGNIAADTGITFEEMAATLGAVSNAGIKSGSTLGTGFRAMLQELQAPSEKFLQYLDAQGLSLEDIDVRARGILPVLETLKATGFDSQQALAAFDVRAASFYSAASRNLDVASAMKQGFAGNGAAAIAAAQQMDTLSAQLTRLGNSTVDLTTSVGGPFLDLLKNMASGVADVFTAVAKSPKVVQALAAALITYGTVTTIAGLATTSLGLQIRGATAAMGLFTKTLFTSPLGLVALAATALAAGLVLLSDGSKQAKNAAEELKNKSDELDGQLTENAGTISELDKFSDQLTNTHVSLAEQVQEAERRFGQYGLVLDDTITTTEQLRAKTDELTESLRKTQLAKAEEQSVVLADQQRALQSAGSSEIVSAADSSFGVGIGRLGTAIRGNADFKSIRDGTGTAENYRALLAAAAAMEASANAGEKRALERFKRSVLLSGNYLALSQNQTSTVVNDNTLRQSRIEGSQAFGSFERGLAERNAANIVPKLGEGGRLKPEFQANFDNLVVPLLQTYLEDTVKAIIAQTPSLAGQEADIRLNLQSQPEYADLMGLRSGHTGASPDSRRRARESLESRWKAATPQDRLAIEPQLRRAYDRDYADQNRAQQYTTIDQGNATNDRMRLLNEGLETRQTTRSSNRALSQTTANRRDEAALVAARLNTGNLTSTRTGGFINPTSLGLTPGQGFGADRPGTRTHAGQDFIAPAGTRVNAPQGGMATAGSDVVNGNWVQIDHGDGLVSKLIHLTDAVAGLSAVATRVEQGDQIGRSGNTGTSSDGAHLHWQLKLNGQVIDPESQVGQQVIDTTAQVIQASQATFETAWGAYVTATMAEFDDRTSEMSADDKANERAATTDRLTLEKAEMLKKNLGEVYKTLIERYAVQADDAIARAMTAAIKGEDTAGLEQLAIDALTRQRDAAVREVMASMEDGDARTTAIAGIMRNYAGKFATVGTNLLEAQFSRIQAEAEAAAQEEDLGFARRQGAIDARSNPNAQRSGSTALDAVHSRDQENLNRDLAQRDVNRAQLNYNTAKDFETSKRTDRDALIGGDPQLLQAAEASLIEAERTSAGLRVNLEQAKIAYDTLTSKAAIPDSPMNALSAGWAGFVAQIQDSKPLMSTLADGLMGTFQSAQQGFKGLLTDVLTGTKSMGDAFKDFTVGILESLLDLATEMLAKQIIMWAIEIISGSFGGGPKIGPSSGPGSFGNAHATGMKGSYHGGLIAPRRASGGRSPSPNRDSVMTFTQPGEFIMSKTATDFIGADTLSEMNASGNRQMRRMPTLSQAMPQREKDEVNVWVVAPNQRPPTGKKDIVAAISDDIINHGQTRQLIKQLQMGGV